MGDKQSDDRYFSPIYKPSSSSANSIPNDVANREDRQFHHACADYFEEPVARSRERLHDHSQSPTHNTQISTPVSKYERVNECEVTTPDQTLEISEKNMDPNTFTNRRFHSTPLQGTREAHYYNQRPHTDMQETYGVTTTNRNQEEAGLSTMERAFNSELPFPSPLTSHRTSRQSPDRSTLCTPRNQAAINLSSRHGSSSTQNSNTKRSLNSSQSSDAVCRICHCSAGTEQLFSPCYCSGSIGLLHISCLQRWLGSSNKTRCELCNFQFTVQRHPKPFYKFLKNPGSHRDKRHLMCDMGCFLFLAPSTITTAFMCIAASRTYTTKGIETFMLYCLSLALMILFGAWFTMCLRHNRKKYNHWKCFNQNVKIICEPSSVAVTKSITSSPSGKASFEKVKLCSVKIKVSTKSNTTKTRTVPEIHQHVRLTEENIARSLTSGSIDRKDRHVNSNDEADNLPGPSRSFQSSSSDSRGRKIFRYGQRYWSNVRIPESEQHISGKSISPLTANTYI